MQLHFFQVYKQKLAFYRIFLQSLAVLFGLIFKKMFGSN